MSPITRSYSEKMKPELLKIIRRSSSSSEKSIRKNVSIDKKITPESKQRASPRKSSILGRSIEKVSQSNNVKKVERKIQSKLNRTRKSNRTCSATKISTPKKTRRIRIRLQRRDYKRRILTRKSPVSERSIDEASTSRKKAGLKTQSKLKKKSVAKSTIVGNTTITTTPKKISKKSFPLETRRNTNIKIFSTEEEAAYAEERLRLHGPQTDKAEEEEAKAKKFAEALAVLEKSSTDDESDIPEKKYLEKLDWEIEDSKKQRSKRLSEKSKGSKEKEMNTSKKGLLNELNTSFEPGEVPLHFVEKEGDLLARWKKECEAKKLGKYSSGSGNEENVAGPSYLSSFDPACKESAITCTPKCPTAKKFPRRKIIKTP